VNERDFKVLWMLLSMSAIITMVGAVFFTSPYGWPGVMGPFMRCPYMVGFNSLISGFSWTRTLINVTLGLLFIALTLLGVYYIVSSIPHQESHTKRVKAETRSGEECGRPH